MQRELDDDGGKEARKHVPKFANHLDGCLSEDEADINGTISFQKVYRVIGGRAKLSGDEVVGQRESIAWGLRRRCRSEGVLVKVSFQVGVWLAARFCCTLLGGRGTGSIT